MATAKGKTTGVVHIQRDLQALNARGILMTCSAGNDALNTDTNPHPPSTLTSPNIIAVAATQSVLPLFDGSLPCCGASCNVQHAAG